MIKNFKITNGRIIEAKNGEISVFVSPSESEKRFLANNFAIDSHAISSALDPDEISRIDYEENYISIILKQPKQYAMDNLLGFGVTSVGVFLFKNKLIIVQAENNPLFEYGRTSLKADSLRNVLLKILHHATNHFLEHLKIIRSISDQIETQMENAISNKHLSEMFTLSKSLTYYESATNGNKVLLAKLRRDTQKVNFTENEDDFLDDIIVENNQCVRMTEIYAGILVGMTEARSSVISNNLSFLMKQLAIINIIFLPLNVIVGLGGMSEFTLMTEGIWIGHSYSAMFLLLLILGFATYQYLRKKNFETKD